VSDVLGNEPARGRRPPRGVAIVVAVVVVVAGAAWWAVVVPKSSHSAAGPPVLSPTPSSPAPALISTGSTAPLGTVGSVGRVSPSEAATGSPVASPPVLTTVAVGGSTPAVLAAGAGSVFAGLWDTGQLLRLDPTTLHTTATLQVGTAQTGPLSVAYGAGAVWVLNFADQRLWRVDPATMAVTLKVALPGQPSQVVVGDGAVWVTVCCTSSDSATRQRLLRIDPVTGAITGSHEVAGEGETVPLAVGPDVLVTSQNGPVLVIDPNTMTVVRTLPDLCAGCEDTGGLVAGNLGIYVTTASSAVRYDPKSGHLLATSPDIPAISAPLSVQPDGVWVHATNSLLRLDPASLAITAQVPVTVTGQLVELNHSIYISSDGTIDKLGIPN
jgi:glutamine cyclotransferase